MPDKEVLITGAPDATGAFHVVVSTAPIDLSGIEAKTPEGFANVVMKTLEQNGVSQCLVHVKH